MSTTTPNYEVDFEDERLQAVDDKYAGLKNESDETYQDMIDQSDSFYNAQIEASKNWADKQSQLQQEQTDFTIEQIEQQKEQAHKDYIKEQSGAYKDFQKQSDKYGVNAEQMAASGMAKTGYSESSQVAIYNQYQSRVTTARDIHNRSILTYDNNMKEARIQNSSILAEIAYKALVEQNELALAGFQQKNNLILDMANKKLELESMRNQEWYQVLAQINSENAMKEEARQFEAAQAFQKEMAKLEQEYKIAYLNAQTSAEKELLEKQHEKDVAKLAQQLQNEKDLWDYKNSNSASDDDDVGEDIIIDKPADNSTSWTDNVWRGIEDNATPPPSPREETEKMIADILSDIRGENEVNTEYYRGKKNPDAEKYGTFGNGYQPKGISGHGKLKDSGEKITFTTTILYGENKGKTKKVSQKVWEAEDATRWYWDGRENKYIETTKDDMGSINDLGLEDASPSYLAELVSNGSVNVTIKDGKRFYSWADTTSKSGSDPVTASSLLGPKTIERRPFYK